MLSIIQPLKKDHKSLLDKGIKMSRISQSSPLHSQNHEFVLKIVHPRQHIEKLTDTIPKRNIKSIREYVHIMNVASHSNPRTQIGIFRLTADETMACF